MGRFWFLTVLGDLLFFLSMPLWLTEIPVWLVVAVILAMDFVIVTVSLGLTGKLDGVNLVVYWFGNLFVICTIMLIAYDLGMVAETVAWKSDMILTNLAVLATWAIYFFAKPA